MGRCRPNEIYQGEDLRPSQVEKKKGGFAVEEDMHQIMGWRY